MYKRFKVILKDANKKNFFLILKEIFIYIIIKREMPYYYFGKFLYRKNVSNVKNYLSMKEQDAIFLSKKFNCYEYTSILSNKLSFALYCQENNLEVPKLLSYNLKDSFFIHGKKFNISKPKDLISYFEKVFLETKHSALFLKPINDMGGSGCILLKKECINEQIEKHFQNIIYQNYIHQELIIQHPSISKINPSSINSIRFDTFIDNFNKVHILSAFIKFGVGNSIVDNASSGGFFIGVNLKNGTLNHTGYQLMKYGGKQFTKHPDTQFIFGGFEIPYFSEVCKLVIKATQFIPDRIIGWDVAITPDGPILVEGNDNNSMFVADSIYGGYLKHPLFKEILEEAKN